MGTATKPPRHEKKKLLTTTYMLHIFDKLGISNRVELVLYAVSNPRQDPLSSSQKESAIANAS
jgi:DNA-binding NarL/FixJ family response regulator